MYAPDFCGGSGERARRVNKMKSDARLRNIVQRALLFPKTEKNNKRSQIESEKNEKRDKSGEIILPDTEKIFEKKKTIVMRKEAATQTEAQAAASTACCHKTRLFF